MTTVLEFLTGRMLQRAVISLIIVWICWHLGHEADSYLPWAIVALTWIMEYLAYTEGIYVGAKGFDQLPESTKQAARKVWSDDE
jgi:hypothetical protein